MRGWFGHSQELEAARVREAALDRELYHAQAVVAQLEQRLEESAAREAYWRKRAEKFIDQIALRQGKISEPAMGEVPPPPRSAAETAFGALATREINTQRSDGSAPLRVSAVDGAMAMQAVADALATST